MPLFLKILILLCHIYSIKSEFHWDQDKLFYDYIYGSEFDLLCTKITYVLSYSHCLAFFYRLALYHQQLKSIGWRQELHTVHCKWQLVLVGYQLERKKLHHPGPHQARLHYEAVFQMLWIFFIPSMVLKNIKNTRTPLTRFLWD